MSGLPIPGAADLAFYAIAAFTVLAALGAALWRHILYAALSLMAALGGVAALFVLLGADFLGGVQLLVYVGGVLVLTLFAVMLTQGIADVEVSNRSVGRAPAALFVGAFFALVARAILIARWPSCSTDGVLPSCSTADIQGRASSTAAVGEALLGDYVLPFELASVVLLAVLVGAVVLSRKETVE